MRRTYKLIVLLAAAALAMAALVAVNLQASRDTGPRRPAVSIAEELHHAGEVRS